MEENRVFDKRPDVIERELDGEVVLLDLNTGIYYGMNEVGTGVWGLLDGKRRVGEIVDWVAANYDVERKVAKGDVEELLGDLLKERLINEADN